MHTHSALSVAMSALLLPVLLLGTAPALASAPATPASPVQKNGSAAETVQTPVDDLNLSKREIPPALVEAVQDPYATAGLTQCPQIAAAVEALDAAIGDDIDLPQPGGVRLSPSELADFAASTFIPFRDIIRTVTGANARKRQLQEAVLAGFARRSFLKGLGTARRCAYPASPATAQIIAAKATVVDEDLAVVCSETKPDGTRKSRGELWLNIRKCNDYKKRMNAAAPAAANVAK